MTLSKVSEFHSRLSDALADSEMTATDLSRKIGLSKQAISTYITGLRSPKLPVCKAIAESLNVDDMWLMGYDVPKERKQQTSDSDELLLKLIKSLNPDDKSKIIEIAQLFAKNRKDEE